MNGFGNDLEVVKNECRLFHSCTWIGLDELFSNFIPDYNISFSTESSCKLFGREIVIVMKPRNRTGYYTPFDSDAGKNYGWDEFRYSYPSLEDFKNDIEKIILPENGILWVENDPEAQNDEGEHWYRWIILEDHYHLFQESGNEFYNF